MQDRSSIQGYTKWRILNKDIAKKHKKLTYFSPCGYSFETNDGKEIYFDWYDCRAYYNENDNTIIESTQFSLDYDFISNALEQKNLKDLVKNEYRLELFKDFKKFKELNCTIDIDEVESSYEGNIECVYFEVHDPISNETIVLLDK